MSTYQLIVAHATKIVLLATLVGLFVRGRHRSCWSFTAYVATVFTCNCLVSFWPSTFYVYDFWIRKQAAYDVLKLAIGIELGARAFAAFPGAMRAARVVALLVLTASTLLISSTAMGAFHTRVTWDWLAASFTAAVWVFGAVALLVLWFRIPVSRMHRAIMMGFLPYLAVFTLLTGLLKQQGWSFLGWIWNIETAAYLLLVSWWSVSAWHRPEPAPAVSPALAARLGLAAP